MQSSTADATPPRWSRTLSWAVLISLVLLLALSSWFAATQPPHPDMFRPIGNWDVTEADWWLHPLERNAFRRTVIGGNLNDVFALPDSKRVWAVGDGGLIVHSDDGGRTWRQQRPRVEPDPAGARAGAASLLPISSAHAADAKSAAQQPMQQQPMQQQPMQQQPMQQQQVQQQQVQQQPLQLEKGNYDSEVTDDTAPAGKSPSPPTSNNAEQPAQIAPAEAPPAPPVDSASADLTAVFFVDARRGWAVGDRGTVIATTNGGASWQPQASGTEAWLDSITFTADGQRGWAVGDDGTLIATSDGGASWQPQASGTQAPLTSNTFAADGQRGWAVGGGGTLIATTDGGASWQPQASGTQAWLRSITFTADGQRGWAVGEYGTVIATTDGGASWQPQASGTQESLTSITFAADGQRGWAVGADGTLIATTDGGASWQAVAQPRIGLAPWYGLTLLLLSLVGVWLAMRGRFGRAPDGDAESRTGKSEASGSLWADRPVEDLAQDRLNYRPTVQALSGFIRNAGTEPHLTLAITGEWGQGKSSVMRMLKRDLEQAGFRTAWFNAWHHQQEGRPMSALFNVIRRQAMPSLFSREAIAALRVRWRLLWGRGGAYRFTLPVMLFGLLLTGQDVVHDYTHEGIVLSGGERLRWSASHHLLGEQRVRLTPESLARLTPVAPSSPAPTDNNTAKGTPAPTATPADKSKSAPPDNKTVKPPPAPAETAAADSLRVRQALIDYLRTSLVYGGGGGDADTGCRDPRPLPPALRCVFDHSQQLFATIDQHAGFTLTVDERQHLLKVATTLPAPPLLPRMEWLLLSLGPLLALLLTKGVSVYGFQLLRPLNGLVNRLTGQSADEKEPTGLIEHYRTEFALLTQALDGRLVLFVDDLDRCSASTVNSLLELTNYLTDIGQCFIVLGVAIEHIEGSIASNREGTDNTEYARRYLRKLIHVEVPVPHRMAQTDRLYDPPAGDSPGWLGRLLRLLGRWLPLRLLLGGPAVIGVVLLALPAFDWMNATLGVAQLPLDIPAVQSQTAVAASPAAPAASAATNPPPTPKTPSVDAGAPMLSTATRTPMSVTAGIAGGALIGTLLLILAQRLFPGVASSVNRALGRAERTFDSAAFVEALRLWHPALVQYDPTPRGVKRFANRARLMVLYERLSAKGTSRQALNEAQVVAVTAIHQVAPELLDRWANAGGESTGSTGFNLGWQVANSATTGTATPQLYPELLNCFKEHCKEHGEPAAADIARLNRRMQDVKVR